MASLVLAKRLLFSYCNSFNVFHMLISDDTVMGFQIVKAGPYSCFNWLYPLYLSFGRAFSLESCHISSCLYKQTMHGCYLHRSWIIFYSTDNSELSSCISFRNIYRYIVRYTVLDFTQKQTPDKTTIFHRNTINLHHVNKSLEKCFMFYFLLVPRTFVLSFQRSIMPPSPLFLQTI